MTDLESLPQRLLVATRRGTVPWKISPTGAIEASTNNGGLRLEEVDEGRTALTVLAPGGQVADTLTTDPGHPGPWREWETALFDLFDVARRDALGLNEILERLTDDFKLDPPEDDEPF